MGLFNPDDIAKLSGVSVEDLGSSGTEQLYMPGEGLYSAVAMDSFARGWMLFPQERAGKRLPTLIDRAPLKISQYVERAPSHEEMRRWSIQAAGSNGAILFGPSSGNAFALDVDCQPSRAQEVIGLASEIMGETPFIRDGSRPAMIYRAPAGVVVRSWSTYFDESEDAVEVLGRGKALTAFGQHHRTGKYFTWRGAMPWTTDVSAATEVTLHQLAEFRGALARIAPLRARITKHQVVDVGGKRIIVPAGDGWTLDGDGLVADGRDAFMWAMVREAVRSADRDAGEVKKSLIKIAATQAFMAAQSPAGAWSPERAREAIEEKVDRADAMRRTGYMQGGIAEAVPEFEGETQFPWIDPRGVVRMEFTAGADGAQDERRLQVDRTETGERVATTVIGALRGYIDDVVAGVPAIHELNAPTGAGKTRKTIEQIAADGRLRGKHLGFLLPTHTNIDEGMDAADAAGLKAMRYQGKLELCERRDEMAMVQAAGKNTAGMCHSKLTNAAGATEDVYCPFYNKCRAIAQRAEIAKSDIVFMPKAYIDLPIVDELEDLDAIVIDESFFGTVVHRGDMPVTAFEIARPEPKPSQDDVAKGHSGADLVRFRKAAATIADKAFMDGLDPADVIARIPNGIELATFAKRVCGSAITGVDRITANMSPATIAGIVAQPESEHVRTEHRFWSILIERVQDLLADEAQREVYGPKKPHIRGDVEHQYQLLGGDTVRVSWLSEPNWSGKPTLLLDASADPEITKRIFPGREIKRTTVKADLNVHLMAVIDRRFSLRTILPPADATPEERLAAATVIHEIRMAISEIAGVHANGRVLVHMNLPVRRIVELDWLLPDNVDVMHPGAVAGLDFGRQHVAAFSIGRMELPVAEIDSQVAALTSNDVNPESPIDVTGTGIDETGRTVYPHVVTRTLPLRDGRSGSYRTQEHAGAMARAVQAQYREEAVRQFVGRLRPIFREDTPYVYIAGQAIPDDLVVDEVCSWQDILNSGARYWDVARKVDQILCAPLMYAADSDSGTLEDFRTWIAGLKPEVLANYHEVQVQMADGSVETVYVPGHVQEPGTVVRDTFRREGLTGGAYLGTTLVRCETYVAPAGYRPIDDVEGYLLYPEDREGAERRALSAVRSIAIRRGEWLAGAGIYRCGEDEYDGMHASLAVWAILKRLDDPWVRGEMRAEAISSAVRSPRTLPSTP